LFKKGHLRDSKKKRKGKSDMELMVTWTEMLRASIDEVHESSTTVEFSKEEGGIGLGIGSFNPLKARFYTTIITTALAKDSATITTHPHGVLSSERN
jgi:hypothetical protein